MNFKSPIFIGSLTGLVGSFFLIFLVLYLRARCRRPSKPKPTGADILYPRAPTPADEPNPVEAYELERRRQKRVKRRRRRARFGRHPPVYCPEDTINRPPLCRSKLPRPLPAAQHEGMLRDRIARLSCEISQIRDPEDRMMMELELEDLHNWVGRLEADTDSVRTMESMPPPDEPARPYMLPPFGEPQYGGGGFTGMNRPRGVMPGTPQTAALAYRQLVNYNARQQLQRPRFCFDEQEEGFQRR